MTLALTDAKETAMPCLDRLHERILAPSVLALALLGASGCGDRPASGGRAAQPDADMQAVLDAQAALHPKPISTLEPAEARRQPTPADGVKAVMAAKGMPRPPADVTTEDTTYPGGGGAVAARIYRPAGKAAQPRPVVLYFRGGGWVIADLDVYDATPRALAAQLGAIVVSADYRMGPEHRFPAAHEDAVAAYRWALAQETVWGGRGAIAIVGESAGGNLAANVAIAARDHGLAAPAHLVLVYPVAGNDMTTTSYLDSGDAKPLDKPMMAWFVKHATSSPDDVKDPRIDLVHADLHNLPSVTIINAGIDPLRSEGLLLAERLRAAGVAVEQRTYPGATHEFFGMAAVVHAAAEAQAFAVERLRAAGVR